MSIRLTWTAISLIILALPHICLAQVSEREYEVYSCLLRQMEFKTPPVDPSAGYTYAVKASTSISIPMIRDASNTDRIISLMGSYFSDPDSTALASFAFNNQNGGLLEASKFLGISILVIPDSRFNSYFRPQENEGSPTETALEKARRASEGWDRFFEDNPRTPGIVTFSRVGFSADGKIAIVSVKKSEHFWAGQGEAYELENTTSGWLVRNRVLVWIH